MSGIFTEFNWVDLLFVILLLGMVYKGIKAGVGGQILSLIGWFVLLFIPIEYYRLLSNAIFGFMLQKWAKPVSFFTVSLVIFIVIKVLENSFHITAEEGEFSLVERVGGALVAIFRASVLYGLIGMMFLLTPIDYLYKSTVEKSKSCMLFVNMDAGIYSWMTMVMGKEKKKAKDDVVQEFLNSSKGE